MLIRFHLFAFFASILIENNLDPSAVTVLQSSVYIDSNLTKTERLTLSTWQSREAKYCKSINNCNQTEIVAQFICTFYRHTKGDVRVSLRLFRLCCGSSRTFADQVPSFLFIYLPVGVHRERATKNNPWGSLWLLTVGGYRCWLLAFGILREKPLHN